MYFSTINKAKRLLSYLAQFRLYETYFSGPACPSHQPLCSSGQPCFLASHFLRAELNCPCLVAEQVSIHSANTYWMFAMYRGGIGGFKDSLKLNPPTSTSASSHLLSSQCAGLPGCSVDSEWCPAYLLLCFSIPTDTHRGDILIPISIR